MVKKISNFMFFPSAIDRIALGPLVFPHFPVQNIFVAFAILFPPPSHKQQHKDSTLVSWLYFNCIDCDIIIKEQNGKLSFPLQIGVFRGYAEGEFLSPLTFTTIWANSADDTLIFLFFLKYRI